MKLLGVKMAIEIKSVEDMELAWRVARRFVRPGISHDYGSCLSRSLARAWGYIVAQKSEDGEVNLQIFAAKYSDQPTGSYSSEETYMLAESFIEYEMALESGKRPISAHSLTLLAMAANALAPYAEEVGERAKEAYTSWLAEQNAQAELTINSRSDEND